MIKTHPPATTNKIPARTIAHEGLLARKLLKINPKDNV